jgi:heme-degrading monooxygenase HmoA
MITERADLSIAIDKAGEFESAMARAIPLLAAANGAGEVTLTRCIERPARYMLQIQWHSMSDHEDFTKTPEFKTFVGIVGPFFVERPSTEHFQPVAESA